MYIAFSVQHQLTNFVTYSSVQGTQLSLLMHHDMVRLVQVDPQVCRSPCSPSPSPVLYNQACELLYIGCEGTTFVCDGIAVTEVYVFHTASQLCDGNHFSLLQTLFAAAKTDSYIGVQS